MDTIKPNSQLFEAWLKCPTKCWILSRDESGHGNAYAAWVEAQSNTYRAEGVRRLKEAVPEGERAAMPLILESPRAERWRLALEFEASANGFSITVRSGRASAIGRSGQAGRADTNSIQLP